MPAYHWNDPSLATIKTAFVGMHGRSASCGANLVHMTNWILKTAFRSASSPRLKSIWIESGARLGWPFPDAAARRSVS